MRWLRVLLVSAVAGCALLLGVLDAAPAESPAGHWVISDLGSLRGWSGQAEAINERGQITGTVYGGSNRYHAFLWARGRKIDLGSQSSPTALNERGQLTGYRTTKGGKFRGFFWSNRKMVDLGTLGGDETGPSGLNDKGQIVGWSKNTKSGARHAFVWQNGNMTDLGNGQAVAINEHGQIVGMHERAGSLRASLWQNGKLTDLGTLGGKESQAVAVNDRGQIVGISTTPKPSQGWHAFMWDNGRMTDLGTLPGGSSSIVAAINERGHVIGWSFAATGEAHAVAWRNGVTTDLGYIEPSYLYDSFALGINEGGQIVGRIGDRAELGREEAMDAFVWQSGKRMLLPTLGGRQTVAIGINDRGQIVGSSTTRTGTKHAVLWTRRP